jgi:hypothetical protein
MTEDRTASTATAPTSAAAGDRITAIEAIIAGRESARYWNDPALQREYRDLLAARADPRGAGAHKADAHRGDDAIRGDVGARADAPASDGTAADGSHDRDGEGEHKPAAAAGPLAPVPLDAARRAIAADAAGAALLDTWDHGGGAATHIARLQDAAQSALRLIADPGAVIADFDALPATARAAVFAELAGGAPGYARPAADEALARFTVSPEGAQLARAWGSTAAQRVGLLDTRARHILQRLSDDDAAALLRWFDGLDSRTAKGLVLALTQ